MALRGLFIYLFGALKEVTQGISLGHDTGCLYVGATKRNRRINSLVGKQAYCKVILASSGSLSSRTATMLFSLLGHLFSHDSVPADSYMLMLQMRLCVSF